MEIRTFAELTSPDPRALRFTPLGLSTGRLLRPESAAEFQQRAVASADLVPAVPDGTRGSFERLRTLHSYGVLCYDAFTVAHDLSWLVLEQALGERFVEVYGGEIPLMDKNGDKDILHATDFAAVDKAFRKGGSHVKGGWRLELRSGAGPLAVPLSLQSLLGWARQERLLHGQRNRRVEAEVFGRIRNRVAHPSGYHLVMPTDSALAIRDLAEIINRLWGVSTPGGRMYPAPLTREVLVVGWSDGERGPAWTVLTPEQLSTHADGDDWTYIVVRGVASDRGLMEFDARYELTTFPTDLLWGPGALASLQAWLGSENPGGDQVEHFDRLFLIRTHRGKVFLACRPEVLLGLPQDQTAGVWHVVRADFANDAFAHVRHRAATPTSPTVETVCGCPVQEVASGTWRDAAALVRKLLPDIQPAVYSEVHVPRQWSFPADVGH